MIGQAGIGAALSFGETLLDKFIEDPGKKREAKLKMMDMVKSGEIQKFSERAGIVKAEAESESWLTSNWRPLTMLTFVSIIANNYILAPYMGAFLGPEYQIMLDIPPDMWALIKIGLGGYVVGRSGEKFAKAWKAKGESQGLAGQALDAATGK